VQSAHTQRADLRGRLLSAGQDAAGGEDPAEAVPAAESPPTGALPAGAHQARPLPHGSLAELGQRHRGRGEPSGPGGPGGHAAPGRSSRRSGSGQRGEATATAHLLEYR